jgi:hypothetical protein
VTQASYGVTKSRASVKAMKTNTLLRSAAVSMAAGGLMVLPALILHPPSHALQYQGGTAWVLAHTLLTVSFVLILFGMFGVYGHLHERLGVIGLIGFVFVFILCLYSIASYAFDAWTVPAIRATFPGETATDPNGSFDQFPNGLFPLPITFLVGLVLFGIAIFRSGFGQRWSGIALAVSPFLIFAGMAIAHSPLHLERAIGIAHAINELAFAWIGFGLFQEMRSGARPAKRTRALASAVAPSAR